MENAIITKNQFAVDFSHWNTILDFDKLKAQTYLILHKATESTNRIDEKYANRKIMWKDEMGMLWIPYHFLKHNQGEDEANYFLNYVKPNPGDVVALDYEVNVPIQACEDFAKVIIGEGLKLLFYCTEGTLKWNDFSQFEYLIQSGLWIAAPGASKLYVPDEFKSWLFWQYTWRGVMDGICGNEDIDSFNGTVEDLYKFCGVELAQEAKPDEQP
jgi:GH25 family lysozyme M1 (1,4-beta-N-acetylmuramidase)